MKNKWLIYTGFLIPILFWTTNIICGLIIEDYDHVSKFVSELGAIGTKSQYVFSTGLFLSSILSVLFVIGLYKTCRIIGLNTIPVLIILTFSFSICGTALFPLPLRLHGILGMPSILLLLSPLMSLILWKMEKISNIKHISLLAFLIMILGFLAFMPNVLSEYSGLKQRFFHIGWTVWFIYLSYRFIGLTKKIKEDKMPSN
jgi:hypothetical membrane protein